MRLQILTLLILSYFLISCQNDFEGIIEYKIEYEIHDKNIDLNSLKKQMGTSTISYIKNGFYKDIANAEFMSFHLFRYTDTSIYYMHSMSDDTLIVKKVNAEPSTKIDIKTEQSSLKILDFDCNKISFEGDFFTYSYYYSPKLKLDPEYYKEFSYNNKYIIMKSMKAPYLKLTMKNKAFTVNITAVNIESKKFDSSVFTQPKNKIRKLE